jgi:hypothetical protein
MQMKLIYPKWPKLPEQTEFHLPPHGPVVFAAALPPGVDVVFVDENRVELDTTDAPDVVALSVMLTSQIPRANSIAAAYRRRAVPVIAGGIAVMLHAEEMAQACDAVFLGEAEGHIEEVLRDLQNKKLKRVYDRMAQPPPCESIGPARRDILDPSLYCYRGIRMLDLIHASRGCRFNCAPCAVAYLGGRHFRPRPVQKVVEELSTIDNHRLFFVDNSLAQDRAWEKELFTALIPLRKKFVSHPIEADDEILDLAYRAGTSTRQSWASPRPSGSGFAVTTTTGSAWRARSSWEATTRTATASCDCSTSWKSSSSTWRSLPSSRRSRTRPTGPSSNGRGAFCTTGGRNTTRAAWSSGPNT